MCDYFKNIKVIDVWDPFDIMALVSLKNFKISNL